ncbi:HEAT repeat domain-containing protein [Streptomyces sp. NPDC059783]|uniref:HEAT repeat domain-containing protein n=1 Tax=Streptomyces sp. NPDC059783 TaxID=3346944 RepID=UPI0036697A03
MRTPADEPRLALDRPVGGDPGQRHRALIRLDAHLRAHPPADDAEADRLAALLPAEPTGVPEADLLLAGLYRRLGHHRGDRPRPAWRTADPLPARVRIAWLRADLLHDPASALADEPPGEALYQAVRATDLTAAHHPARLVDALADSGDPVLRTEALRLAREGLYAAVLAPSQVRRTLLALLATGGDPVVAGALDLLAEPWAATAPLRAGALEPFLLPGTGRDGGRSAYEAAGPRPAGSGGPAGIRHADPAVADAAGPCPAGSGDPAGHGHADTAVAEAALRAAACHGHRELLFRVLADPDRPPLLRRRAAEALGGLAERGDIAELTALAGGDPLLLGGPAVTCLRGLHRRGHFPDGPAVPAVVGLALADHTIPPDDVATVLHTVRHEALRVLTDAPAADPGWPRRLALLVALAGQGAGDLPAGEAVVRLLPEAQDPVPFLAAIRALRPADAEEAVLALLPRAPAAALDALEAVGGERTVRALHEGLGTTTGATAPYLRSVAHRAVELLRALDDDPDRRRALLDRLDPDDLPPRIAAGLGAPDARETALLTAHLAAEEPETALRRLAAHGDAGTLPALAGLLLRIVGRTAAGWRPDAPPRTGEDGRPAGEPAVAQDVLDALAGLGRRLYARGAIRPVCLLDAPDSVQAGHALVASTALDLLDRPGLPDDARVVLLELLLRTPWPGTRARVHPLLRHRDRHVRKHVVALLGQDTTGRDAQALSATLVALTRAPDIQTVRQALLALEHARAHWASAAVAACLDHPNMNIRKTAAQVLGRVHEDAPDRTAAPAALPALLDRLGRDTNPGLRTALVAALRAVLGPVRSDPSGPRRPAPTHAAPAGVPPTSRTGDRGRHDGSTYRTPRATPSGCTAGPSVHGTGDAYAATLLAAAEHTTDEAVRLRILEGLDGVLTARAVLALDAQRSPVARPLLTLAASHAFTLADGAPDDLAPALTRHGIPLPPAPEPPDAVDRAIDALATAGWDPAIALRLAEHSGPLTPAQTARLRPTLADWLALVPERRPLGPVLRLALALCADGFPFDTAEGSDSPLGTGEESGGAFRTGDGGRSAGRAALVRAVPLLLDALAAARDADRYALIGVLEAVAPLVPAPDRPDAVAAVRALAPVPARPGRSTLTLLRRLDAVLVRDDLDRALTEAGLGADPWRAETALLAEAFGVTAAGPDAVPPSAPRPGTARPGSGPSDAPGPTAEEPSSRLRLAELVAAHRAAAPGERAALVDRMLRLQPLDGPEWTLAERARAARPDVRLVRDGDLDQPRSAAQRERLLALLASDEADRRQAAADALARWPEPEVRLLVLRAHLHGRVDLPAGAGLTDALAALDEAELRSGGIRRDRVAALAARLDPRARERLLPLLLEWWGDAPPAEARALGDALRAHPADALAEALRDRLDAGAWGFLDLLAGRPLLRTPALLRVRDRLRAEGHGERADRLRLVTGPLRDPGAERPGTAEADAHAPDGPGPVPRGHRPTRHELLDLAETGTPDQICRALTDLAGSHTGPGPDPDPRLAALLDGLLTHPRPRVRLRAHRTSRTMLGRDAYLRHTALLLDDPRPDVVRMAARTLCRAGWAPAIPAVTALLGHPHPAVRETAAASLTGLGAPAVPALRHAAAHARPDRRSRYTDVLDRIGTG